MWKYYKYYYNNFEESEKKNLSASTEVQYDISVQWHTDARVATLIIVSGWEWYGLAEKCNVLPFYILNSGSHEPLQGDASSDFNRNFNLDTPCYLSPSEPPSNCTSSVLIKHRDRDHLAQWYGERSKRWRRRPLRGMSTGRQSWHRPLLISDTRYSTQHFKTVSLPRHASCSHISELSSLCEDSYNFLFFLWSLRVASKPITKFKSR